MQNTSQITDPSELMNQPGGETLNVSFKEKPPDVQFTIKLGQQEDNLPGFSTFRPLFDDADDVENSTKYSAFAIEADCWPSTLSFLLMDNQFNILI